MFATLLEDLSGKGLTAIVGLLVGGGLTWLYARWKRLQEKRSILRGDARDTVVIQQHMVQTAADASGMGRVPVTLHIRSLGQAELNRVVPNGHLEAVLLYRAFQVSPRDTLISMDGAEGSYLLETLTNFVCDRVSNGAFEHDLYVMAPCCEPAGLAEHQPITILLISLTDLALFENWKTCRDIKVEHGSDGLRILTLMQMARRFRAEQDRLAQLRQAGQRTKHVETMYILDLALDRRVATLPLKEVPWGRFEDVLKQLNLE